MEDHGLAQQGQRLRLALLQAALQHARRRAFTVTHIAHSLHIRTIHTRQLQHGGATSRDHMRLHLAKQLGGAWAAPVGHRPRAMGRAERRAVEPPPHMPRHYRAPCVARWWLGNNGRNHQKRGDPGGTAKPRSRAATARSLDRNKPGVKSVLLLEFPVGFPGVRNNATASSRPAPPSERAPACPPPLRC